MHSSPLQTENLSEQYCPQFRLEEECQSAFPSTIPVAIGKRPWYFSLGCCPSLICHHSPSSSSPPFPPMRKFNPLAHTDLVNFSVPVCHCRHGNSPPEIIQQLCHSRQAAAPCLLCHLAFASLGLQELCPLPGSSSRAPSFPRDMFAWVVF